MPRAANATSLSTQWQTGCPLSPSDQLDGIDEAMLELGASVEWLVAPDVVADASHPLLHLVYFE